MELSLRRLVLLDIQHLPIPRHGHAVHRAGKHFSAVAASFLGCRLEKAAGLLRQPGAG